MEPLSVVVIVLIAGVAICAIAYFVLVYNNLVSLKANIERAWANIDVILKQRHEELPKLVSVCESYAKFERQTLEKIVAARQRYATASSTGDQASASAAISNGLGKLFAVAEAYPELKANQQFATLQSRVSHLEESLADRREIYNDSVNLHNIRIQQIPDLFVASLLSYRPAALFPIGDTDRQDVRIEMNL